MRNRSRLARQVLAALVMMVSAQSFGTADEIGIRQITTDSAKLRNPAISGARIVWTDYRNNPDSYCRESESAYSFSPCNADIYLYDLATNTERQITTDPTKQRYPAISGDRIVWTDYRNGDSNSDIYLYDLATNTERQITTHLSSQRSPVISGDRIVWFDGRNGITDIYLYDLATNTERRITTDPARKYDLDFSGDRIVWTDYRDYLNPDIYLYDLATNTERRITTDPSAQYWPAISGDRIVWTDYRNDPSPSCFYEGDQPCNTDIYLYDLATNTERRITTDPTKQRYPAISCDQIVWEDYRNATASDCNQWYFQADPPSSCNIDIYLYDLATDTERQITTDPARQRFPAISDGRIVWMDFRSGNWDIYLYDPPVPPVLASIGNSTVAEGDSLNFVVTASDPNGDPLTFSAENLPVGATVDAATGVFEWMPSFDQAGSYAVTFTVTDGALTDEETVTLTVTDVPLVLQVFTATKPGLFSPNGDGRKDTTTFSATFNHPASWELVLYGWSGPAPRRFIGISTTVNQVWDGTDEAGVPVPDFGYTALLTGTDVGNSSSALVTLVTVDTTAPVLSNVTDTPDPFQPAAGKSSTITVTTSEACNLTVTIRDAKRTKRIRVRTSKVRLKAAGTSQLVWDGTDDSGVVVPPGPYTYWLIGQDRAGNRSLRVEGTVTVQGGRALSLRCRGRALSLRRRGRALSLRRRGW